MQSTDLMPSRIGVRFAHASVQAIADSVGVDILHIKGPAVHHDLLEASPVAEGVRDTAEREIVERPSLDADILVRPAHVPRLMEAMRRHGWVLSVDFADGSAFEHAATMRHPLLAYVDVHRRFPGFGPDAERVFNALWVGRQGMDIAGRKCTVPEPIAQRLLLILNAVRGGPARQPEIARLWNEATAQERADVERFAVMTGAEVALAAATGRLDDYANDREHDLWMLLASGRTSPFAMWSARVRAQASFRARVREAVRLLVPNARRLAFQLGRPLTRRELASAWVQRICEGFRALGEPLGRFSGRGRR